MRSVYNSLAKEYDMRQDSPATMTLRQKEVDLIKRFASGKVLDLGCGTGYHMDFLENCIGLDISEKMLKVAKVKGKPLMQANIESLPVKTGYIDTICCFFSTLNFVGLDCVGEISRTVKTGGKILLSVTSVMDMDKFRSSPEAKIKKFRIDGQEIKMRLFEKEEVVEAFGKNGFRLKYFNSVFRIQKPRWGNFQRFSLWERLKLKVEMLLPKKWGKIYLFVFEKSLCKDVIL